MSKTDVLLKIKITLEKIWTSVLVVKSYEMSI